MPAMTFLANPVDVTPVADGTWKDVDVSAHVSNASGVYLGVYHNSANPRDTQFRKKGSIDEPTWQSTRSGITTYVAVGLDVNNVFQCLLEDVGGITYSVYLIGYMDANDCEMFTNLTQFNPPDNSWQDIDISSLTGADTAIAAIFTFRITASTSRDFGYQMKGSTDNRIANVGGSGFLGSLWVGVDVNEVFQLYKANATIHIVGYFKSGVTMNENAPNTPQAGINAWETLSNIPANSGCFFDAVGTLYEASVGVRPQGNTNYDKFYRNMYGRHVGIACGSVNNNVEGNRNNANTERYLMGIVDAGVAPPTANTNPIFKGMDF